MGLTQTKPISELPTVNSMHSSVQVIKSSCEDLHIGTSLGGTVSAVRRFFCLLTTFDLVFTFLLWIIVIMLSSIKTTTRLSFEAEVLSYKIHTSLFDIVMLSAWRFTLILLAYALFRISHWWVIAITTAGSGAFVIAKVFLYDWTGHQHVSALAIVLLLSSFIISWGEAWFLDFRVIPSETKASYLLAQHINERTPLIPPTLPHYCHSEDGSVFFSPPGSDVDSDTEYEQERHRDGDIVSEVEWLPPEDVQQKHLSPQDRLYKKRIETALEEALDILKSENWKTEKVSGDDVIQCQQIKTYGKVYKFVGVVSMSAEGILEELVLNLENVHTWNPTIKSSKILHKIDSHTDIVHIVATEAAGGLVASRDFVNIRTWQRRGNLYIFGSVCVDYPGMPVQPMYTRGEQGPNAYVWCPVEGEPNKCHLQWLLNTNLKGWLPQYLIDQTLSTRLLDCVKYIRDHAAKLRSTDAC